MVVVLSKGVVVVAVAVAVTTAAVMENFWKMEIFYIDGDCGDVLVTQHTHLFTIEVFVKVLEERRNLLFEHGQHLARRLRRDGTVLLQVNTTQLVR